VGIANGTSLKLREHLGEGELKWGSTVSNTAEAGTLPSRRRDGETILLPVILDTILNGSRK